MASTTSSPSGAPPPAAAVSGHRRLNTASPTRFVQRTGAGRHQDGGISRARLSRTAVTVTANAGARNDYSSIPARACPWFPRSPAADGLSSPKASPSSNRQRRQLHGRQGGTIAFSGTAMPRSRCSLALGRRCTISFAGMADAGAGAQLIGAERRHRSPSPALTGPSATRLQPAALPAPVISCCGANTLDRGRPHTDSTEFGGVISAAPGGLDQDRYRYPTLTGASTYTGATTITCRHAGGEWLHHLQHHAGGRRAEGHGHRWRPYANAGFDTVAPAIPSAP